MQPRVFNTILKKGTTAAVKGRNEPPSQRFQHHLQASVAQLAAFVHCSVLKVGVSRQAAALLDFGVLASVLPSQTNSVEKVAVSKHSNTAHYGVCHCC
jgi:hypothetical protein